MAFVCLFVFFLTLLIFNEFYAPYKRTQHCWLTTPNILDVTCCVPFAHPVAWCCVLLESVAQSLRPVKLLTTCKRTQQLPTLLGRRVGSCFVRSQVALNYTDRGKLDRYLRSRAGDS